MPTSNATLLSFLEDQPIASPRELSAAITLAESMVGELSVALEEWQATVRVLHELKRQAGQQSASN